MFSADTHRTVMHSVELKRTNLQKLRRELEQLEQETETKLVDIDNGNIQVKVRLTSLAHLHSGCVSLFCLLFSASCFCLLFLPVVFAYCFCLLFGVCFFFFTI